MEIEQNLNPATPAPPMEEKKGKKEKGGDVGVILLNIFLALITIFLLGYIAYKNGYINLDNILNIKEEGQDEEIEEDTDEETEAVEIYEGEVLSATLPMGWTIVEYLDGEGSDMMTEGLDYTGLTGMKILKGSKEIMRLEAVWGIGFVGCAELPRFSDSSLTYEKENEDMMKEIGDEEISYIDHVGTPYSEFEWLGRRIRRINVYLYYDTVNGDEYFEPQCEKNFLNITGLEFEDGDGYKGSAYMYTISDKATSEELEILDKILSSMEV